MNQTRKLTYTAILAAITTASSSVVYIPLGFAKIFPIQHFVNILAAVMLGPWYAVMSAFLTSTMRNLLGTGSIFAYPGSMIGAFLAAFLYQKTKKLSFAAVGEVFGTGILGALATYPIAILLLGQEATLLGFIPAFTMSSLAGALLGFVMLKVMVQKKVFSGMLQMKIK
ncbi:energy coupling factor transporter S component ThiW [Solibacillus sp. MA9]|uniref:Energy coupling factor transporter S component ThiW n=1 Tax=Solibacillus palustris TaxID=2908203 RepID=A0ABS9UID3_9BACL|nr:energy coupling factor transporter S component ThiW [Solibacillus sp. MA9]MCH7323889.1 energy coupling factor transporter S component ThiW [Solibacillus sp. MA9]